MPDHHKLTASAPDACHVLAASLFHGCAGRYALRWREVNADTSRAAGRTALGVMYRGALDRDSSELAIKMIEAQEVDKQMLKMLNREALALAALPHHADLVKFVGAVAEHPRYAMVDELMRE